MYRKSKGKQESDEDVSPAEVPQDVPEEAYKTVSYAKKKKTGYSTLVYRVSKDNTDIPIVISLFAFVVTLGFLIRQLFHSDSFYLPYLGGIVICLLGAWICGILYVHGRTGKIIANVILKLDSSFVGRFLRDNKDMTLFWVMLFCFLVLGYSLKSGRPLKETADSVIYLIVSFTAIFMMAYSQIGEIRKELQNKGNKAPEETDTSGKSICTDGKEWTNDK